MLTLRQRLDLFLEEHPGGWAPHQEESAMFDRWGYLPETVAFVAQCGSEHITFNYAFRFLQLYCLGQIPNAQLLAALDSGLWVSWHGFRILAWFATRPSYEDAPDLFLHWPPRAEGEVVTIIREWLEEAGPEQGDAGLVHPDDALDALLPFVQHVDPHAEDLDLCLLSSFETQFRSNPESERETRFRNILVFALGFARDRGYPMDKKGKGWLPRYRNWSASRILQHWDLLHLLDPPCGLK